MSILLRDELHLGKGSRVHWSTEPTRDALVFVHGFRGHATKTWGSFPQLLRQEPSLTGWDLVFFGYESAERQAAVSAEELLDFLRVFATRPGACIGLARSAAAARPIRGSASYYRRIVVAAHSLGAAVVRHALVQEAEDAEWPRRVSLVLYAPAHAGAKSVDALVDAVGDLFRGSRLVLRRRIRNMPVIDDLVGKTGFLRELRERTLSRLNSGSHRHLIAQSIANAEFETVVDQVKFIDADPDGRKIAGSNHRDVCKPKVSFREPFDRLISVL